MGSRLAKPDWINGTFNAFIKSGYIECLISKLSDLSRVK